MTGSVPPGWVLILGALLVPLLPRPLKRVWMLLLPALSYYLLPVATSDVARLELQLFDYTLTPVYVDGLVRVWGAIFHLAAFLALLFALKDDDDVQSVGALVYAGSAIGGVYAGDLITLFVYWELTAISSVFLIWARRTERSFRVGLRYLLVQVGSGVILLTGVMLQLRETGSLTFEAMSLDAGLGPRLILLAFGIKAAFPLLNNWLMDAYPEATVSGTVFLSAFTTKLAIYALARGFPGTHELVWIGAVMTVIPILYAFTENDLRRVLAYALNNQLGFMVVGVGLGTELALNGVAAHAFCHILYKLVLFMAMGAVFLRAGTCDATRLGGLWRSMPLTTAFCCVGALASFPLFCSFVSKSMILSASAEEHETFVYFALVLGSASVFVVSGVKIVHRAFLGADRGYRVQEAPWNMLLAMGLTAFLCIAVGVYPAPLYDLLPFEVAYEPYTVTHVVTYLQLLLWAGLAYVVLKRYRLYPQESASIQLDTDWVYRRLIPTIGVPLLRATLSVWNGLLAAARAPGAALLRTVRRHHGSTGLLARTWPTGSMALWVALMLATVLLLYYAG